MYRSVVRALQRRLKDMRLYVGRIDGIRGPLTHAAVVAALDARPRDLPDDFRDWSNWRKTVAFLQLWCHDADIDAGPIDGYWGPQTDYGIDELMALLRTGHRPEPWREPIASGKNPHGWPTQDEASLRAFYGAHGHPKDRPSPPPPPPLTRVRCPWPLKIAWDKRKRRSGFLVHARVADSLAEIVERIHAHYGGREITRLGLDLFGGDYTARRIRGGRRMSTHSWGIAIDFDPAHNQLKWGRDRARMAGADYDDWWRIWEAQGWVSLGRARNFDWMHVQAARLGD